MASAQKPSDVIRKARRKLTEALIQIVPELILGLVDSHLLLWHDEFFFLSQIKDPQEFIENLIDTVLERGRSGPELFLACLENMRCIFPNLKPISEYSEDETPVDPWESAMCGGNPIMESLPEKVRPAVVWNPERSHKSYKMRPSNASSLRCSYTNVGFETKRDVTLKYQFDLWPKDEELNKGRPAQQLSVAGPLINIQTDRTEAVEAVHYPHFLSLKGNDSSHVYIAHCGKQGITLQKPDSVGPSHAVLKTPRFFSPSGVIVEKSSREEKIEVHTVALLYQSLGVSVPKFHLYLLPNDTSLRKAVHEHELNCPSQRVQKPPETTKPLVIGSRFFVPWVDDVTTSPKELELKYLNADMEQQYFEVYAEHMKDRLQLKVLKKEENELVWEACVRQEELKFPGKQRTQEELKSFRVHQMQGAPFRPKTIHYYLMYTLEDLKEYDLKKFKNKLNRFPVKEGFSNIPTGALEKADVVDLTNLLCNYYREIYAIQVTAEVLESINCKEHARSLLNVTGIGLTDEDTVIPKAACDQFCPSPPVTKGRSKTLKNDLSEFKLGKYERKKLTLREIMEISAESVTDFTPYVLGDLPWHFLRKVLALNVTARNTSLEQGILDDKERRETKVSVNPLDVLCAVLLCSDSFLQQEVLLKMSMCQFALPLLLPPLETPKCTLMLWAMRDIVKRWTPHSPAESKGFVEESLVLTSMPTISFVRVGNCNLSKSKFLNKFLSPSQQHHDFFIHRDMECGNIARQIANGLIEMAWYFPGGLESSDLFPEPVAIANLRGDAESNVVQFRFLTQVSSTMFIFAEGIDDTKYALLSLLKESSTHFYFILERESKTFNETFDFLIILAKDLKRSSLQIVVKETAINEAKFVESLQSLVGRRINFSLAISIQKMADVARELSIQVDEDSQECQNGLRCVHEKAQRIKDIGIYKKEMAELQKKDLKTLKKVVKELFSIEVQGKVSLEQYRSEMTYRLWDLHKEKNEYERAVCLINFIDGIKDLNSAEKKYFLKWMKYNLDHIAKRNFSML